MALAAAPLLLAPSWIRGNAAARWVDYYAALDGLPRPHRTAARAVAAKSDIAIRNLAPLPQASAAAIRALEIGERAQLQDRNRDAALLIYESVAASCARVRARPFSGPGFAVIEARAAALASSAQRNEPQ